MIPLCVHSFCRTACERKAAAFDALPGTEDKTNFAFDFEVYKAFLRFYAEIFSGYRKFLFFIHEVPYFNG